MKPPVLVVGGDGLIGRALTARLRQQGEPVVATVLAADDSPHVIHLDLTDETWPALPAARAAVICAAVTSQEQCRRDPAGARHINVSLTLKLIGQLLAADTFVVFLSTNLVFDGRAPRQRADAPFSPRTEYGRQKAEVERALASWAGRTAVVRLTKVLHGGLALLEKWRGDFSAGRAVAAFTDYVCSPIPLATVTDGLARIACERRPGIWQFSGPADVTYAQLARDFAALTGADPGLVRPVPTPPGTLEHQPSFTTLDATRAADELGLVFPGANEVLKACV